MSGIEIDRALCLPPSEVGRALLVAPENQWFDRKSSRVRPPTLANALVGFANAEGGVLVVGLHDGQVEGVGAIGDALNDLQQTAIDFTVPPVAAPSRVLPCVRGDGVADHLLVFEIRPAAGTIHTNHRDEVYLRIGDETRKLSFAQRQELLYDRGQDSYEATATAATFTDLDRELIDSYVSATGAASVERLFQARGLSHDDRLTVAGCLLFANHPQALFPEAYVRVLRYRGVERGTGGRQQLLDDQRFEGPIPRVLEQARAHIAEVVPSRRALASSGRFERVPLIPHDAWLEGLVNAVIHRSYSVAGDHIRVEVFDDRVEISSPGRFPGIVALSDPREAPRFARNPRIARVCADLHFGQELGEGILRIYEEMQIAGLSEPVYRQTAGSVQLILRGEPTESALDAQLGPEARAVSAALRDSGRLSTGEVADLLGRSRPVAIAVLESLKEAGVIRWVGKSRKDPRAYWELDRG